MDQKLGISSFAALTMLIGVGAVYSECEKGTTVTAQLIDTSDDKTVYLSGYTVVAVSTENPLDFKYARADEKGRFELSLPEEGSYSFAILDVDASYRGQIVPYFDDASASIAINISKGLNELGVINLIDTSDDRYAWGNMFTGANLNADMNILANMEDGTLSGLGRYGARGLYSEIPVTSNSTSRAKPHFSKHVDSLYTSLYNTLTFSSNKSNETLCKPGLDDDCDGVINLFDNDDNDDSIIDNAVPVIPFSLKEGSLKHSRQEDDTPTPTEIDPLSCKSLLPGELIVNYKPNYDAYGVPEGIKQDAYWIVISNPRMGSSEYLISEVRVAVMPRWADNAGPDKFLLDTYLDPEGDDPEVLRLWDYDEFHNELGEPILPLPIEGTQLRVSLAPREGYPFMFNENYHDIESGNAFIFDIDVLDEFGTLETVSCVKTLNTVFSTTPRYNYYSLDDGASWNVLTSAPVDMSALESKPERKMLLRYQHLTYGQMDHLLPIDDPSYPAEVLGLNYSFYLNPTVFNDDTGLCEPAGDAHVTITSESIVDAVEAGLMIDPSGTLGAVGYIYQSEISFDGTYVSHGGGTSSNIDMSLYSNFQFGFSASFFVDNGENAGAFFYSGDDLSCVPQLPPIP